MSALKERKLVWEETGKDGKTKLKFAKVESTPEMKAHIKQCLATKPLDKEEFENLLVTLGDRSSRHSDRIPTGKVICRLPEDAHLKEPYEDLTPRDWRGVSIRKSDSGLNLVHAVTGIKFLPGARRFYGFPEELRTEGLTFEEAVTNGRKIESLIKLKS